ncbi:hypothetical protein FSO04_18630 [Paraburkholderia madseniana]|uniref:Uncharacterized protein n=1 Tax=Paraburkholderia madseniana TaxID=2599607 RepID=A0A6N6WCN2_9BURK|nr:hypothetical protein [Paraburkholderia madseniana]KAE8758412.1 hypothetical protein FSO04_18630 [Paraburkholderia madseniana]
MTATSRWAFGLAIGATGTALSLSILAGWQRGGSLPERIVWVAIGMVLVTSAHLLPALLRNAPLPVRGTGSLLWGACLATACYGHTLFFVLAQQHAGELRALTVSAVPAPASARSLTVVMWERTTLMRQLAFAQSQHCPRDCSGLEARRVTLGAKLDALDAEANDIRRQQVVDDRVTAQRDALRADPVTSRLAVLLGTTTGRIDLLSGLVFAAVLEGVACLLWTVALRPPPAPAPVGAVTPPDITLRPEPVTDATHVTQPAVTTFKSTHASATVSHGAMTANPAPQDDPVTPLPVAEPADDDVTQLARDVAAGRMRPTVSDIRRHLGCSQARAVTLRRQLAERNVTA